MACHNLYDFWSCDDNSIAMAIFFVHEWLIFLIQCMSQLIQWDWLSHCLLELNQ